MSYDFKPAIQEGLDKTFFNRREVFISPLSICFFKIYFANKEKYWVSSSVSNELIDDGIAIKILNDTTNKALEKKSNELKERDCSISSIMKVECRFYEWSEIIDEDWGADLPE